MSKTFWVNIHYYGAVQMQVTANDEDEARETAEKKFSEINDSDLVMDGWDVDSVQEVQ